MRATATLDAQTIALVTFHEPPAAEALLIVEAAVICRLNRAAYMLNTVSAARAAALALGPAASATWAAFGEFLATALHVHAFGARSNHLLSPASTLRETAVRVVQASGRALDTDEVLAGVDALTSGHGYRGSSASAIARRDLAFREVKTIGSARVRTTHHAGRCLFFRPDLPRETAVARYLARQSI